MIAHRGSLYHFVLLLLYRRINEAKVTENTFFAEPSYTFDGMDITKLIDAVVHDARSYMRNTKGMGADIRGDLNLQIDGTICNVSKEALLQRLNNVINAMK